MKKNELIILDDINANSLPEFQGWKEKQEGLVKENPFIAITDHKTYEEAKKRRTALVKGRTEIQKQDKLVASKLKEFRGKVSEVSTELIQITQPHEDKQQAEVKRYEELKAQEKAEKERIENERKEKIKKSIEDIFNNCSVAIKNLKFKDLEGCVLIDELNEFDTSKFEEFELDFAEKVQIITNLFNDKKQQLEISEKQRLEDERLKKEREALEEEKRIAREKAEKEAEKKRKEQERIDAKNKKKADELAKKEAEIEEEKKRLAKVEADRIAKEEAERKTKEEAKKKAAEEEARIKKAEALKPDLEKMKTFIESLGFESKKPKIKDDSLRIWLDETISAQECFKQKMINELKNLS